MVIDQFQRNFIIENFSDKITITIQGQKKWGWFLMALFPFILIGLCGFPFTIFIAVSAAHINLDSIPITIIIGLLMVILYIYTIRRKFLELIDYVFDKEVIEIDEHQIKVLRSGFLGLRTEKNILVEDVKGITGSLVFGSQFNFLNSIPFASSNLGSILIWKRKGRFRPFDYYGKALSQADAQQVLGAILQKYPRYSYTDNTIKTGP